MPSVQATLLPDSHSILYFGGLCKGKRFNDTHIFDVNTREWSNRDVRALSLSAQARTMDARWSRSLALLLPQIAGTPPHPRSHHTATLVEFDEEDVRRSRAEDVYMV